MLVTVSGCHFSGLAYKFYGACGFTLLLVAGDASVDSWLREIHVSRAWHVYLATGFDFREKNHASFGLIRARVCCQPPTLPLTTVEPS